MKKLWNDRLSLGISMGGFLLTAVSFLLMPFNAIRVLAGILFWVGLLVGIVFQILLERQRRVFFRKFKVDRKKTQKPRNGLMSFGSNFPAKITDIALAVSIAALVLVFVLTGGIGYVCYVFIASTMLTFSYHCIFNGRIFFHVKNQDKIRRMLEQKKANTQSKGEGEK